MQTSDKKRMLITGISGLLGNNLACYFREHYDVLGLYNTHPVTIRNIATQQADILSLDSLENVIQNFQPDIIIHCASLTDIDYCEVNKSKTHFINVIGTKNIIDIVQGTKTKIIYISSDSVYEGTCGNYSEDDQVNPQNHYGLTKYEGELEALKKADSLILRTNIFGWNIQDKFSIAEWILHELTQKNEIKGFQDAYFSSIYTFDLAEVLHRAINRNLSGVYNCGSSDSTSKYEFALMIADLFQLDKNHVCPISIDEFPFRAKRGKNLSLNISKISKDIDFTLPLIGDTVKAFYSDCQNGIRNKLGSRKILHGSENRSLSYGKQFIDENDVQAVIDILNSPFLTQGPVVVEFENALCVKTDASYAVACNSGTSGLHIACMAAGVGPGDEVVTSPVTFVASANCAVYCGAKPVFADIDSQTYNMSPVELEKKITGKTRAVIPVHFAGQSCDMESIKNIVTQAEKKYGRKIFIIEDACHALGSEYKGTKVGSCRYADMAVTSFHPVKHITTGEGGAVFTADKMLDGKLRKLRSHGITSNPSEFLNYDIAFQSVGETNHSSVNPWYYEQVTLGYNYRITDIQCALGLSQLKKLEAFKKRRRELVNFYNKSFSGLENIKTPYEAGDCLSNFHLYVLLFEFEEIGMSRAALMKRLKEKNIQTQVHYIPVHLQSFYRKNFGTTWGHFPKAESYYTKCLSIPLHPSLSDDDAGRVVDEIIKLTGKNL
jgi:UDP-4-amino-4,6-dideoxy-N-acetyl-beta-L-altrosamine transaminase/dTDP-4-dehydrorhamnose reductase